MNLKVEIRQPASETSGWREPRHRSAAGVAADDDGSLVGPARHQYSFLAECECPDDCLRDHENE